MKKIVILFSGAGNNMQRIIQEVAPHENITVCATITNKEDAKGIEKVKAHDIPVHIIKHQDYDSRESFDQALVNIIDYYKPDLVVLAGFMRILTPIFTDNVKAINLHPSILPHFKGAKAIEQSFEYPDKPAGISVHWVSAELDSGAIIAQKELHRIPDEPFDSYKNRIHLLEYELLPQTVIQLLQ